MTEQQHPFKLRLEIEGDLQERLLTARDRLDRIMGGHSYSIDKVVANASNLAFDLTRDGEARGRGTALSVLHDLVVKPRPGFWMTPLGTVIAYWIGGPGSPDGGWVLRATAAEILNCSRQRVAELIKAGRLGAPGDWVDTEPAPHATGVTADGLRDFLRARYEGKAVDSRG